MKRNDVVLALRAKLENAVEGELPGHFLSTAEVPLSMVLNPKMLLGACLGQPTHSLSPLPHYMCSFECSSVTFFFFKFLKLMFPMWDQ